MRTEYLAIQTAIELFEEFRTEVLSGLFLVKSGMRDLSLHAVEYTPSYAVPQTPKELANFLFYVSNEPVYFGDDMIEGISLYGKCYSRAKELDKIDFGNLEFSRFGLTLVPDENICKLAHGYDYSEMYREDYNYATLVNALTYKILYYEVSVKYDDFALLMHNLKKYIKENGI